MGTKLTYEIYGADEAVNIHDIREFASMVARSAIARPARPQTLHMAALFLEDLVSRYAKSNDMSVSEAVGSLESDYSLGLISDAYIASGIEGSGPSFRVRNNVRDLLDYTRPERRPVF